MRTDWPARRGTATPPGRGRRRPVRRLLPTPGFRHRRCASAWRPAAPLRAGTESRAAPSHARLQHGSDFDYSAAYQYRSSLQELGGLGEILRLDQRISPDNVLGLGVWAVGDGPLRALDQLPRPLERVTLVLDVALVGQPLHPGHPSLHALLQLLRRSHGGTTGLVGATVQVNELAHGDSSRGSPLIGSGLAAGLSTVRTFQGRCSGHAWNAHLGNKIPGPRPWRGLDAQCTLPR